MEHQSTMLVAVSEPSVNGECMPQGTKKLDKVTFNGIAIAMLRDGFANYDISDVWFPV